MGKKYFFIKCINLILIVVLILAYQHIAMGRADKEAAAIERAKESARKQREEAGALSPYKDGQYKGTAEGYGGQITMEVTIKDGSIENIRAISHDGEDAAYWNMARGIADEIVDVQDTDVDSVSGATVTSIGIINASTEALQKALK